MTEPGSPASSSGVRRLAITGTDTGVGKTVVATAITALAYARGVRVAAMKPIESGVAADDVSSDAHALQRAAGGMHDLSQVRPYLLAEPLAPMVAAARAQITIDLARLDAAMRTLGAASDLLVIEGAGGLLVPITDSCSYAALFARWQCELLIVAANRLGVLNHTLLTIQAASSAGLSICGVVLTPCQPGGSGGVAESSNLAALRQLCGDIPVFEFPWIPVTSDQARLVAAAEEAGLDVLLPFPT